MKQSMPVCKKAEMLPHMGGVEFNSGLADQLLQVKTEICQNFGPVQAAGEPRGKHASVIMY